MKKDNNADDIIIKELIENNEPVANIVVAKLFIVLAAILFMLAILFTMGVLRAGKTLLWGLYGVSVLLGTLSCVTIKSAGKIRYQKSILLGTLMIILFVANILCGFKAWLIIPVPIVLSSRYYDRRFSVRIGVFALILTIASAFANVYLAPYTGFIDLNTIKFSEPGTLKYYGWLFNAVIKHGFDEKLVLKNSLLLSAFPNCLAILLVILSCYFYIVDVQKILIASFEATKKEKKLNQELMESKQNLETRFNIINSMTSIYFASFYIDLVKDTFVTLKTQDNIVDLINESGNAQEALNKACDYLIVPEYQETMKVFWDLSTINERLKDKDVVSCRYIGTTSGWSMAYLIAGDRDEEGNLLHLFYACRTIRDEQEREAKQVRKLEDINRIVSSAGLGVWHIIMKADEAPRVRVDEKMKEILGIGSQEMTEAEAFNFWYSRVNEEELPVINGCLQELVSGNYTEITYLWNHPEKGRIYVRCGANLEALKEGLKVIGGYCTDVTKIVIAEKKQKTELAVAKDNAESANKAKTAFLLNMSHDIRTPLNAIIGYTELIQMHNADKERCMDYISKIQSSGDYLLSLVNNVLDMARIESGKVLLNVELCRSDYLKEVVTVYQEEMRKKKIECTQSMDVKTEYIYGDKTILKEIALNLISNAYKYTKEGGKINISVKELPHPEPGFIYLQTTVSDNGIGMSEDFLPVMFEKFTREQNTTESKIQGTGLGMPIVKKYVELMDGTITVQSEVGKGTTFVVTIPHEIASEEAVKIRKKAEDPSNRLSGKKVLLAEDNDLNAEIAMDMLKDEGLIVDWVEDGAACVEKIKKAKAGYYNLVLMDIQMPEMDGYEATKAIRALDDKEKAHVPIVAMTANAFNEDRKKALDAGMNGHITKPVKIEMMMEILAGIID